MNNSSVSINIPVLSCDLIEELDSCIPSCVLTNRDFDKSLQQIWYEAGQRALVETLKARLALSQEEEETNNPFITP